ncbi:MAG TPA: HEAT repeat domain-containing protein, partial [Planctomycetota bacterium]|nr:HEAT repeat domain-containing protein [Planctomycetota bacterium]
KIQDLLDTRAAAVKALGGFRSDDTVETLLKRMRSLSDEWDREGLAEAAGKVEHAAVSPALIERVKEDKSWRVRVVALDSLRARKAVEALDAAIAALRDAFWQVQVAAVEAVEAFGDKRAVPGLIEALKGADGRIKAEINRVLAKLTGVDKGGDPAAWSSWWEQNRGAVERGEYKPSPSEAADNKAKQTTFYGIPIESKRLVFVIDKSGSMVEPSDWKADGGYIGTGSDGKPVHDKPEGTRKIDIAKFELRMAIRGLPEDTLFTIVSFADNTAGWKETLVPANKKNKEEAIAWVNALDPSGGTNTFEALRSGFAVQGPPGDKKKEQGADTLFFLTDGRPSVGEITDTAQILAKAAEWNATRKIKINTIAVGKENLEKTPEGGGVDPEFLKQLAEAHRGFHVWRK